jgi:hypothetical protein
MLKLIKRWSSSQITCVNVLRGTGVVVLFLAACIAAALASYALVAALPGPPLLAQSLPINVSVHGGSVFPHIRTATITYARPSSAVRAWQVSRHDFFIGGPDPRPYNPNARWVGYKDFQQIYLPEATAVKAHAASMGADFESYYLHMDVDYTNALRWVRMDRFGNWENGKGVFTYDGSSFRDETTDAYDVDPSDVPIAQTVYLGYGEPFDEVNFVLSRGRSGGEVIWQYWSGADWRALTPRSDATSGLSNDGMIRFTPPEDWAATTVSGSLNKWWVRATVSGASTTPIASRIYGDNWFTGALSRGWAAANPGRVVCCGGTYEYDPAPPYNATARFRHQGRVRSFFSTTNDNFLMNHSYVESGVRMWSHYAADRVVELIRQNGYNAIMLDNGDSITGKITGPSDWRDRMDWKWPYHNDLVLSYRDFAARVHAAFPDVLVGANGSSNRAFVFEGDFILRENFIVSTSGTHDFSGVRYMSFDDFLPAKNPGNVKGILMYLDTPGPDGLDPFGMDWYAWDRGNRRPIAALAFYYVGANGPVGNTYFHYNSVGTTYATTDEVYYYSSSSTALAAELPSNRATETKSLTGVNLSPFPSSGTLKIGNLGEHIAYTAKSGNVITFTEPVYNTYPAGTPIWFVATGRQSVDSIPLDRVYRWTNWFPAMGVDVGAPDPFGHNGGLRDLSWRTGPQYGDPGGRPVWRRDYTKAIILLRAASSGTRAARFNSYTAPLELGGTFYRLRADGITDPVGATSIQLREGEGAILMKHPVGSGHRSAYRSR